jgi:hypothetical protein
MLRTFCGQSEDQTQYLSACESLTNEAILPDNLCLHYQGIPGVLLGLTFSHSNTFSLSS